MMILTTLSRHTSNSWNDLIKLPMHLVLGLFNTLKAQFEEENKQQKEAEKKQKEQTRMPNMPNMANLGIPSSGSFKVPNINVPRM